MNQNKYFEALDNFKHEYNDKIIDLHFRLKEYNKEKCNGIYNKSKSSYDLLQLIFNNSNYECFLNYSDDENDTDESIESYN